MVALHIVLWNLALVLLHLFLQEVHRKLLLQKGIAFVLLIREHTAHRLLVPCILTHRRLDASARQFRGDGVRCHTLKEQAENQPHSFSTFGICYNLTRFFILVQTEKATIGKADFAVRRALALSPGDIPCLSRAPHFRHAYTSILSANGAASKDVQELFRTL